MPPRKESIQQAPSPSRKRGPSSSPANVSAARRWAFRLVAALLLPLLLLAGTELCLRLFGWGNSADFFRRTRINNREVYVENDQFGLRFFPPHAARTPSPLVMSAEKPAETCRVFIFGESAALGDPEPAFGFGRYLRVLLEERFPGTRFEVVNTAMTAINSHAILPIARECRRQNGDLWVIYMGNNEFVGPFGPSTVFGPQAPPLSLIRLNVALKATRLGQLLARFLSGAAKQKSWGGMQMFLANEVSPDDSRKQKVYAYFQRNLEDILSAARQAGAKVVLCSVAANLKDCPPFASRHATGLAPALAQDWARLYAEGAGAEQSGDFQRALTNYLAAAGVDSSFAALQFRLGQCYLALTNPADARKHYSLARDYDALPFRADARLNEIVARAAARGEKAGVAFADCAAAVQAASPLGVPGSEMLFEHVHLNFEGNELVARTVASAIVPLLPASIARTDKGTWAASALCARHLGLTDWDRSRVLENVWHRLTEPPFTRQSNHEGQLRATRDALAAARARCTSESARDARLVCQDAIKATPDDFYLRAGLAKLLEDTGDLTGAIPEWERARDLIPFAPGPYFYLGKLLARLGRDAEALQQLSRALEIRPDIPDALLEKAQVLLKLKEPRDALKLLETAAQLQPGSAHICFRRAEALAILQRRAEAVAQLREAVRLQPDFGEARYLLGVELALDGNVREAAEQFQEVIRLSPGLALGHLNLGIALAKLGRVNDAADQFRETLRLEPGNRKAAEYLAQLGRGPRRLP